MAELKLKVGKPFPVLFLSCHSDFNARINAIKSSMKIRSNSSDVTDSHYVDVALDAYIKTGGKYENFAGQLELHKKMYRFQNQNESPQFKQPLHVSENRLYA